jgi:hypothetical protein
MYNFGFTWLETTFNLSIYNVHHQGFKGLSLQGTDGRCSPPEMGDGDILCNEMRKKGCHIRFEVVFYKFKPQTDTRATQGPVLNWQRLIHGLAVALKRV